MIRHNWKYKLLALASAWALYLMYGRGEDKSFTSASVRVPVRAVNVAQGLETTSQPMITVSVRGPRRVIDDILGRPDGGASEVEATIDLNGKESGTHTLRVKAEPHPPLTLVPGPDPSATVTLEDVVQKSVSVEVVPQGTVASGYRWEATSSDPPSAEVSGPASAVAQVARLEARVPVRGASGDIDREVFIRALDSRDEVVEHVHTAPTVASVHVRIARVLRYKVAPIVLQTTGQPADGLRVARATVDPPVVTVSGSGRALESVQAVSTQPVDLTGATDTIVRRVPLAPPQGIQTVSAPSAMVKIFLMSEAVTAP